MKVLHVMPSVARAFGGPTEALIGYLRASSLMGIEVAVAAPAPSATDAAWLRGHIDPTLLKLFGTVGNGPLTIAPALARWTAAHGQEFDAIHVHGCLSLLSSVPACIALARRRPLLIRPFGTLSRYSFEHRRRLAKRIYFAVLDRPHLRRAAALHFTTIEEATEASRHDLGDPARMHVVPPPLSVNPPQPGQWRRSPTILFLGRLHPKKGVEILLDAWAAVASCLPEARLIVAGGGEPGYVRHLMERGMMVARATATDVRFVGFVTGEAKAAQLAEADVFVLPSHQENFGVGVLEAIAAGVPVVVSPDVQLASFVREHKLGLVVSRTASAVSDAIVRIVPDLRRRERIRRVGPQLVATHFGPRAIGERLATMYEAAVARGNN